jgi:hypothetical protein
MSYISTGEREIAVPLTVDVLAMDPAHRSRISPDLEGTE